ncbi:uncharacterized protein LOC113305651 [Papaver somniferum]|uniref:uncharacterized protein LOC113305651 n=1 Tax=Papaver somniferum TaxID=3469 RepID=UPI000E705183|nr:uncharacterized protein LOC113305651 [Papaver somniferum]
MATKEKLQEISSTSSQHTDSITEIKSEIQYLSTKMNIIIGLLEAAPNSNSPPDPSASETPQTNLENSISGFQKLVHNLSYTEYRKFSPTPKVDFPRFNGTNPRGWALKCVRYFQLHNIPDNERVDIAAIHFDSSVDLWFIPTGGLKEEIRTMVQMFKPDNNAAAFYLAILQQASMHHQHKSTKSFSKPFAPSPLSVSHTPSTIKPFFTPSSTFTNHTASSSSPTVTHPTTPTKTSSDKSLPPVKRLTRAQMQVRKHKRLCYNCDEFYRKGHRWRDFFTFLDRDAPDTIRIVGHLNKHFVIILIDTGNTHCFIDDNLTSKLGLHVSPTRQMLVTVANGDSTLSQGICHNLHWDMQGHQFSAHLRVLPLGGCDIVLGADWLRQLDDVTFNFSQLNILFLHQGSHITLQGITSKPSLSMISGSSLKKFIKSNTPALIPQFFSISTTPILTPPPAVSTLLGTFADVFAEPTGLPPSRSLDHKIPLKHGSNPTSQRPYKCPFIYKSVVESLVSEILSSGVIQPIHSTFSAPILLVKKKDGTWHFFVDYRKLNDITAKDKFPIPLIKELLDELNGSVVFSRIDLRSGYYQIRVYAPDVHKTAFRTHQGHYEFIVMPFGLTNAPATFQALMNEVFQPYPRKFVLVFFDDILVYSPSISAYIEHLQLTLSLLRKHFLFAKMSKCAFAQPQLEYLGHIITTNGVAADPDKVAVMVNWPQPHTLNQLRGFLGLTGYYRKFIKDYGNICKPLTNMLKRDSFSWNDAATLAFSTIKQAMTSAPVLALPEFCQPFTLETDACSRGIGVLLMQNSKPIAFLSKPLGPKVLALSTYEKEFLAIVMAVQKWKHYLSNQQFIIHTYHQSLKYLLDQNLSTALQQKWLVKLMGFDYVIKFKKGLDNKEATLESMGENSLPGGLLQPLPIPDTAWQHISLDFIEGLPMSFRKNVILVVVDRLTKYSHFIPPGHPLTAVTVAKEFLAHVFKLHGLPSSIVSDRDKIFISNFWQALFKTLGTTLKLSSAYHPQTDGHTERTNACVEQYLRQLLKERDVMLQLLKEELSKAQSRMKFFAYQKRSDMTFAVGDLVYLNLQPYRQTSMAIRKNFKLSAKYFGPFEVLQRIEEVAYKLKLHVGSRIHPVFDVSQLKKKIGLQSTTSAQLPLVDHAGQFVIEPVAVLDTRITVRGSSQIPQVLVQWCNADPADSTWEDAAHIKAQFPYSILEDKDF